MKFRGATKIAIGFGVLTALVIGGYRIYTTQAIKGAKFDPVIPGRANVVGIDPGAGYSVIVANQMAQLVQSDSEFQSSDSGSEGASTGSIKKRIPIREMLGTFQGDSRSIGEFVRIMNDIKQDEQWPTDPAIWKSEEVDKAMSGDLTLAKKLERDINMKLDGTPLASVRPAALYNGILVDFPIPVRIQSAEGERTVVGRLQLPYRPKLLKSVDQALATKQADTNMIIGTYAEQARAAMTDPSARENVRKQIQNLYSPASVRSMASAAERVLRGAQVLINEGHITGAELREIEAGNKKKYDIRIHLTEEGRRRLWKYSTDRVGSHVLLIVNGIAVAAPRISHQLTQTELTIGGMEDQVLAREAVDELNAGLKQ
ncbi:MAG TPA: hypothetical protein VK934_03195 [Fimbriimonas sp.]|nr:hypothetical protein [Fimbriimonas sp.]